MRIAVLSDQLSDDLEEAIQLGLLLELDTYELRWVRPPGALRIRRVGELSEDEASVLGGIVRRHGVTVSAISPGLFRSWWSNGIHSEGQLRLLERCFHLAKALETRDIIIHGFLPPEGRRNGICPPSVIAILTQAAERAERAGLRLLLRNAPDCYSDTGAHTASIVHAVHMDALGVSWDPCHAVRAGENAICEGYEWVSPFVRDVCVKDQKPGDGLGFEDVVVAEGSMDWRAQLQALARDHYQGTITLGSQVEPRLLSTMHSLEALRKLLREVRAGG